MTTPPTAPEEDFRDPALSRLYREHAQETPSATIDAAILARAQQACSKPIRKRSWWKRFSAPFALAVTVVLAVLVSLNADREQPAFAPPGIPVEQPPAPVETRQPTPPSAVLATQPQAQADAKVAEAQTKTKIGSALKTESAKQPATPEKIERHEPLPTPFPSAPPVVAGKTAHPVVQLPPEERLSGKAASVPSPTVDAPSSPPFENRPRAAAFKAAPEEHREMLKSSEPDAHNIVEKNAIPLKPEAWIEKIRKLRREGKMTEAEQSLAEFRRAYPDYKLPEDLR